MKKYIFVLMISSSLFATSSLNIGVANSDIKSRSSSDNIYMAYNFIFEDNKADKSLLLGLGLDLLTYKILKYNYNTDTLAYVLSPQMILGYKYKRLKIMGALGYGVHRIDKKNYWGPSYDAIVEFEVYKWFGVGYKHKEWSNSYKNGSDRGNADIFYIKASF